ncbi:MAG: PaaI family thioesterase [Acidimicrobiales bacterium]
MPDDKDLSHEDIVAELRRLIDVVRTSDVTSAGSEGVDLDAVMADMRRAREALAPHVVDDMRTAAGLRSNDRLGGSDGLFDDVVGHVEPADLLPYSPVIGPLNPISPPFEFWVDGEEVRGVGSFAAVHSGPPSSVHGGIASLILDEVMALTSIVNRAQGYTGTLIVRYEALVPLDNELTVRGFVDRTEGRKTWIGSELRAGDEVVTTAEGLFIRPRD